MIQAELKTISLRLESLQDSDRICISKKEGRLECESRFSFWEWVPSFLSCILPQSYRQENRETIEYFQKVFGKKRVEMISARYGLDLGTKAHKGLALSRKEVEQLFVGVGDVRKDDVNDLFQEIKSQSETIRWMSSEETQKLRQEFQYVHEVSQLTKEKMDRLFDILIPFETVEDIFLQKVPRVGRHTDRSDSWWGRKQRVFLLEDMRRRAGEVDSLFWEVRVGKRIIDEDLPPGVLVYHPHGYYEMKELVENRGAYKLFLKPATFKSGLFRPMVAYLSTRAEKYTLGSVYSRLEGFWKEIASKGVMDTYERTNELLTDPRQGFIDDPKEKIWLLGMSIGGAQAERDTCLFMHRVEKATMLCNPGIDKKTVDLFARVSKHLSHLLTLNYIVEVDDVVPRIGESHIGYGCDPTKVRVNYTMLSPLTDERASSHHLPLVTVPRSYLQAAYELLVSSLLKNHSRDTTAKPHRKWTLTNFIAGPRERMEFCLNNMERMDTNVLEEYRKDFMIRSKETFPEFWKKAVEQISEFNSCLVEFAESR